MYSSLVIHSFKHSFIQSKSFIRHSVASSQSKVELQTQSSFNNFGLWGDGREECQPCRPVIWRTALWSLLELCAEWNRERRKMTMSWLGFGVIKFGYSYCYSKRLCQVYLKRLKDTKCNAESFLFRLHFQKIFFVNIFSSSAWVYLGSEIQSVCWL